MKTGCIHRGSKQRYAVMGAMKPSRLVAGLCVALGILAALGAAWLIWQAPHCRPVAAHAYYTPFAAAGQCARSLPRSTP